MKKLLLLFIMLSTLFSLGLGKTAQAQKHADLQLTIVSPQDGAVIPYGDTAFIVVSVKNLGPDTLKINRDSVFFAPSFSPVARIVWADIAPNDSAIFQYGFSDNIGFTEDDKESFCVYLLANGPSTYTDTNQLNDTDCVSFTLKGMGTIGIASPDLKAAQGLALFPNPAQGLVTLNFNQAQKSSVIISVYDLLGRQVLNQEQMLDAGRRSRGLDISGLHPGLYLIKVQAGSQLWVRKLSVY